MNASEENETDMDYVEYEDLIVTMLRPNWVEWTSLPIFAILLAVGLTGNFMVVFVVLRNETMRTVTNMFLVNLALADFLVLVFCLPPTILWDVTKTWWFGTTVCKIILYVQNVAVSVSVLTLVAISVERWYAICNPLKFKSTMQRTVRLLVAIWTLSLFIGLPDPLTVTSQPHFFPARPNFTTKWATQCADNWGPDAQLAYQLTTTILLFFIPLAVIAVMYGQIAFDLWLRSTPPGDAVACRPSTRLSISFRPIGGEAPTTIRSQTSRLSVCTPDLPKPRLTGMQKEIHNRRKAAKMLIAVVILFVICYLPVHVLNLAKALGSHLSLGPHGSAFVKMFSRFLVYFNSAINPILYNFMCERFQKEFRRVCCCLSSAKNEGFHSSIAVSTYRASSRMGRTNVSAETRSPPFNNRSGDPAMSPLLKQVLKDAHHSSRRGCSLTDIAEAVNKEPSKTCRKNSCQAYDV